MVNRPAEQASAVVGSIVGALVTLLASVGVNISTQAAGAIVILVSWVAALVTWYVGKKQRAGIYPSARDGSVK